MSELAHRRLHEQYFDHEEDEDDSPDDLLLADGEPGYEIVADPETDGELVFDEAAESPAHAMVEAESWDAWADEGEIPPRDASGDIEQTDMVATFLPPEAPFELFAQPIEALAPTISEDEPVLWLMPEEAPPHGETTTELGSEIPSDQETIAPMADSAEAQSVLLHHELPESAEPRPEAGLSAVETVENGAPPVFLEIQDQEIASLPPEREVAIEGTAHPPMQEEGFSVSEPDDPPVGQGTISHESGLNLPSPREDESNRVEPTESADLADIAAESLPELLTDPVAEAENQKIEPTTETPPELEEAPPIDRSLPLHPEEREDVQPFDVPTKSAESEPTPENASTEPEPIPENPPVEPEKLLAEMTREEIEAIYFTVEYELHDGDLWYVTRNEDGEVIKEKNMAEVIPIHIYEPLLEAFEQGETEFTWRERDESMDRDGLQAYMVTKYFLEEDRVVSENWYEYEKAEKEESMNEEEEEQEFQPIPEIEDDEDEATPLPLKKPEPVGPTVIFTPAAPEQIVLPPVIPPVRVAEVATPAAQFEEKPGVESGQLQTTESLPPPVQSVSKQEKTPPAEEPASPPDLKIPNRPVTPALPPRETPPPYVDAKMLSPIPELDTIIKEKSPSMGEPEPAKAHKASPQPEVPPKPRGAINPPAEPAEVPPAKGPVVPPVPVAPPSVVLTPTPEARVQAVEAVATVPPIEIAKVESFASDDLEKPVPPPSAPAKEPTPPVISPPPTAPITPNRPAPVPEKPPITPPPDKPGGMSSQVPVVAHTTTLPVAAKETSPTEAPQAIIHTAAPKIEPPAVIVPPGIQEAKQQNAPLVTRATISPPIEQPTHAMPKTVQKHTHETSQAVRTKPLAPSAAPVGAPISKPTVATASAAAIQAPQIAAKPAITKELRYEVSDVTGVSQDIAVHTSENPATDATANQPDTAKETDRDSVLPTQLEMATAMKAIVVKNVANTPQQEMAIQPIASAVESTPSLPDVGLSQAQKTKEEPATPVADPRKEEARPIEAPASYKSPATVESKKENISTSQPQADAAPVQTKAMPTPDEIKAPVPLAVQTEPALQRPEQSQRDTTTAFKAESRQAPAAPSPHVEKPQSTTPQAAKLTIEKPSFPQAEANLTHQVIQPPPRNAGETARPAQSKNEPLQKTAPKRHDAPVVATKPIHAEPALPPATPKLAELPAAPAIATPVVVAAASPEMPPVRSEFSQPNQETPTQMAPDASKEAATEMVAPIQTVQPPEAPREIVLPPPFGAIRTPAETDHRPRKVEAPARAQEISPKLNQAREKAPSSALPPVAKAASPKPVATLTHDTSPKEAPMAHINQPLTPRPMATPMPQKETAPMHRQEKAAVTDQQPNLATGHQTEPNKHSAEPQIAVPPTREIAPLATRETEQPAKQTAAKTSPSIATQRHEAIDLLAAWQADFGVAFAPLPEEPPQAQPTANEETYPHLAPTSSATFGQFGWDDDSIMSSDEDNQRTNRPKRKTAMQRRTV